VRRKSGESRRFDSPIGLVRRITKTIDLSIKRWDGYVSLQVDTCLPAITSVRDTDSEPTRWVICIQHVTRSVGARDGTAFEELESLQRSCVTILCRTPAHGLYGRVSDKLIENNLFLERVACTKLTYLLDYYENN
jgi:hypothetical protein